VTAAPASVVSRDGTSIAAWRSGEGPPVVLIHGAAADHNRWAPVLPALEERFTVFAVDRRGRGRSGDANDYALEREFEDVVAVVESTGEAVDVLGHSYGGICAVEAALLTDRIRKLVLYEPPMGFLVSPPHVVEQLQALLEAGRRDELLAFFMQEVAGLPTDQVELMRSLPAWGARLDAADTIPREQGIRLRSGSLSRPQRANAVPPRRRQPRPLQGRRRGTARGSAGLPGRRHAGAATCRDGHRHRLVHLRSAELSGGELEAEVAPH
jgi:pimeloyl-ACP methyl ester carboxylesterase